MAKDLQFKEIQRLVYEPYSRLGFKDQWEMTKLKEVVDYLGKSGAFVSAFKLTYDDLIKTFKDFGYLMKIAEIGLFSEEIGELLEAIRKDYPLVLPEKKSKNDKSVGEECADLFIRLSCFCERIGLDLEDEILKKHRFNSGREYLHGKKA